MESLTAALPVLAHKPLQPRPCVLSSSASPPPKPIIIIIKTASLKLNPISKLDSLVKIPVPFALMNLISAPPASFAAEAEEIASAKINLESLLLSIDDFFNRNPFFVSALAFVWLVVVPLTQDYLSKCKFVAAIDVFRKLRDDPTSQLLDIRDTRSSMYLPSPNLKILNKKALQVRFVEGEEDDFVNNVLERFKDPANTTLCILDDFDGNSLRVAELLFKTAGFKEAYAIRGGLRGKDGWQAIQETLLPPSTHVFPKKNGKESRKLEVNRQELKEETNENGQTCSSLSSSSGTEEMENGYTGQPRSSSQPSRSSKRSLSPYPNYPDLRPPSSPTPSRPKN